MQVFKILRDVEWRELQAAGETVGSAADRADGFVHLSKADQLAGTAARHFAGECDLWLIACDADALGPALCWEPSRGGALFPHLYRALRVSDVRRARPFDGEAFS
jgi:uncharacterized protein (DUF952 family)